MSTFKKVISLVLCLTMLLGTFAVAFAGTETETSHTGDASVIKTVAELKDGTYKSGNYLYLGIDFYEKNAVGAWEITDHYVQPGDTIRGYFYLKSNLYIGAGAPYFVFERSFFDVTNAQVALTYDTKYDPDKTDYPTESYPGNIANTVGTYAVINDSHPTVSGNGLTFNYTTKWARNIPGFTEITQTNWHGVPLTESDTWDFWYASWKRDTSTTDALRFESDEHFYTFDIKVREFMPDGVTKLPDGKTGFVKLDKRVLTIWDNERDAGKTTKSNRASNISTFNEYTQYSKTKALNQATWLTIDDFITEDCNHTFTIGEPVSPDAKKYTITFIENDGTEISSEEYVENTNVTVPAVVENELGWANVSTGKIDSTVVSGQTITAVANATYKRVLSTDKFDVTVNLDGGTIDGETTLVIKAGYGEEVDLTAYAPEKPGFTAVWEPSTVTVESINGASAKVKWEAKAFQATFYANKGDENAYKVIDIKYNTKLECAAPVAAEGLYFDGWVNAATDELASSTASIGLYTKEENTAYYAKWTPYPHKVTFMVKDFVTGEWKEFDTLYAKSGSVSVNQMKEIKAAVTAADLNWEGNVTFARGNNYTSMSFNEKYASADIITEAVAYEGAKVIYIHAFPVFEIEFQIPVYDEATGEYKDEYTRETKTLSPTAYEGTIAFSKAGVAPAAGYTFDKWVAEDGAQASYHDSGANYVFSVSSAASAAKQVVKAQFKLEEYELRFNIGTSTGDTVKPVNVKNIGDVLDLDTAEFVYATGANKGQATTLPEIGVAGEAQENVVHGKEGYKLIGWYFNGEAIEADGFEITPEIAAKASVASDGTKYIIITSQWEAQNYDVKFYFWAEGSTLEKPVYTEDPIVVSVPVNTSRADAIAKMSDADLAKINASVPEGMKLTGGWRDSKGNTAANPIPAGGESFYAIYDTLSIKVWVDWNSKEDDSDWKDISNQGVRFGDDTMRGEYNSPDRGVYHYVTSGLNITDIDRPSVYHEIVGWKVYHVKDAATAKDPSTWLEGTNDDGTSIAVDTLIYQAQWKQQKDFFFRVYDIVGELSMGLGKDFKMYYWKDGRIATKDRAVINTDENMLVLFFKPVLENFSWDGFFKIDMWKNVALRFDPFYLSKDMLTFESIAGLFKALGTAIKTLIKGA